MAVEPIQRVAQAPTPHDVAPAPAPPKTQLVLPDLPRPSRIAQNQGLPLPPPAAPTLRDIQRLLRERAGEQPGSPQWYELERQRLGDERYRGDDARQRDRQWRDDFERRELERRRLQRP